MMIHLPSWPINKVCKNFAGLPLADKKIDASDDLSPRQEGIMKALNQFMNLYTNFTGDKDCNRK